MHLAEFFRWPSRWSFAETAAQIASLSLQGVWISAQDKEFCFIWMNSHSINADSEWKGIILVSKQLIYLLNNHLAI
jgi:hypothetical protein